MGKPKKKDGPKRPTREGTRRPRYKGINHVPAILKAARYRERLERRWGLRGAPHGQEESAKASRRTLEGNPC